MDSKSIPIQSYFFAAGTPVKVKGVTCIVVFVVIVDVAVFVVLGEDDSSSFESIC